jgi:hypothetical protein
MTILHPDRSKLTKSQQSAWTDKLQNLALPVRSPTMKNVQIIDGAANATFSVFQATDEEYVAIFPNGCDKELVEDLFERLGNDKAARVLTPLWSRPILKRDAVGIHGTLFYDNEHRGIPLSKREVDWDDGSINPAQRELFSRLRE